MATNLPVVFWSLVHLRPSMIYWRVHRTVKGGLVSLLDRTGLTSKLMTDVREDASVSPIARLGSRYHCEDIDLNARRFSFLKDVLTLPTDDGSIRSAVAGQPLLWQFHFGYHDYLLALLDREDAAPGLLDEALRFTADWERLYPATGTGVRRSSWHPYVLSIRIEAWIRLYTRALESGRTAEEADLKQLARGVEAMTRSLLRNLEKGTMANHLLRNIKAMVLSGLFLDTKTGAQARRIGLKLLGRELREQVLSDGCHFERSPMYHVSMLSDVLDMAEAIAMAESAVPEELAQAAASMTAFLERMRHPDGEIPYFNDSTRSFFLRTGEVLQRGTQLCAEMEWTLPDAHQPRAAASEKPANVSGLLTASSARNWIVFDAGNVGPDYQPGHAHCDTLGFEWSLDNRRMVTDTGVFHYRESRERSYSRSTAAHSTVEIDGVEQSEVWKSFRVGRRAKILHASHEEVDGITVLHGAHDGYRRLAKPVTHERAVVMGGDEWIAVIDWLHGKGTHQYRSFFHFHPDADIAATTGRVDIRLGDATVIMQTLGPESLIIQETECYPAFGEKQSRQSVILQNRALMPQLSAVVFLIGVTDLPIRFDDDGETVHIQRPGLPELQIGPKL